MRRASFSWEKHSQRSQPLAREVEWVSSCVVSEWCVLLEELLTANCLNGQQTFILSEGRPKVGTRDSEKCSPFRCKATISKCDMPA